MPTVLVEPKGGPDGNPWDDGSGYTGVRSINLTYKEAIGSFSAIYDLNGSPVPGPRHQSGDYTYHAGNVPLNFPVERITEVRGYIGIVPNAITRTPVVRSITFKTNTEIYGPFGPENTQDTAFNIPIPTGAYITGFVGRTSGDYLNAIGFYITTP